MPDEKLKELLFEVFSAGFEAGYSQNVDIVTAFNRWLDALQKEGLYSVVSTNW